MSRLLFLVVALVASSVAHSAWADDAANCQSGTPDAAIASCSKLLKSGKYNAQGRASIHAFRAGAYLRKGLLDDALADASRAIQADPKYSSGYYARAGVYSQKGDLERALADLTRVIQLEPNNAWGYHGRGTILARQGDLAGAIPDFDRAIALDQRSAVFFNDRGHTLLRMGELDRSIADLNRAIDIDPRNAVASANRGLAYVYKGDPERAMADFIRAIDLNPTYAWGYHGRAAVYWHRGEFEKALADLNRAIELDPKQGQFFNDRASTYFRRPDLDKGLADAIRAAELEPSNGNFVGMRGVAYALKGDIERGLADLTRAIDLSPKVAGLYSERGSVHAYKGDNDRALADLLRAIDLDPKLSVAHGHRARIYIEAGDVERGLATIERAIELDPRNAGAYRVRAMAYLRKPELQRALADVNKAISLDPHDPDAYSIRADVYIQDGDLERAIADLRKVLSLPARRPRERDTQVKAAEALTGLLKKLPSTPTGTIPAGPGTSPSSAPGLVQASRTSKRVALVIGNSAYTHASALKNPANDARILASTLRQSGFTEVTEKYDLGLLPLINVLKDFGDRAAGADWAVIYFAGHGIEMNGVPYLIPVDAKLERDTHVPDETVALERLLQKAEGAKKLRLVILDACRNNPFMPRMVRSGTVTRSLGRGLPLIEPEGDVLVAYATKHGTTALDGEGDNSPYAVALTRNIPAPNVDIRVMFGRVRDAVRTATSNQQEPYTYGSIGGDLHFFTVATQ